MAEITINSQTTEDSRQALGAFLHSQQRARQALASNSSFFQDPAHIARVAAVRAAGDAFFKVKKAVYEDPRGNRGKKPFTTVTFYKPDWTAKMQAEKKAFHNALDSIGNVEYGNAADGYFIRVY